MYYKQDVFMKNGCRWRQQSQSLTLSPTLCPPSPQGSFDVGELS